MAILMRDYYDFDVESEIETAENQMGDTTIANADDFALEVVKLDSSLSPNGERIPYKIQNPKPDGNPRILRVVGYRKGDWYKLLEVAREWGLEVTDVWQTEADHDEDLLKVKLAPRETAGDKVVVDRDTLDTLRKYAIQSAAKPPKVREAIHEADESL